jgi:hypothetical protein
MAVSNQGSTPSTREDQAGETGGVLLTVHGQGPAAASPPLFSNFLAISSAGPEVQLEFIFLDLNEIAQLMQRHAQTLANPPEEVDVEGRTVAKIIMPAAAFLQLKSHLIALFEKFEKGNQPGKEGPNVSAI